MNSGIHQTLVLSVAVVASALFPGKLKAQTYKVLHSFAGPVPQNAGGTNIDGNLPYDWGGLALSGNTLFGTTIYGGVYGLGTVFAINTDGTSYTNLHSFQGTTEGERPYASLVVSGSTLFGTTVFGGRSGVGTVYKLKTDGTDFTTLHEFGSGTVSGDDDVGWPGGLIVSSNVLFGTAGGGLAGATVFKIGTDGSGFANLYKFPAGDFEPSTLVSSADTLYGTSSGGGDYGFGLVFALKTDGTGFRVLHSFGADASTNSSIVSSDGIGPSSRLLLSDTKLYGTAAGGGRWGSGTVFALNIDGTGFSVLHHMAPLVVCWAPCWWCATICTNNEGGNLQAGLALSGNVLYGIADRGGSSGPGTVFALDVDGAGFQTLYSFSVSDGGSSDAELVASGNSLYGVTPSGGSAINGTVFSLSVPPPGPQLAITSTKGAVVLTWPTNLTDFTLQSTMNLGPSAVWTPVGPGATLANEQNTVTRSTSEKQQFYRLSQ
jgi:uncharacterized repeat protein (TIGR03803 family)